MAKPAVDTMPNNVLRLINVRFITEYRRPAYPTCITVASTGLLIYFSLLNTAAFAQTEHPVTGRKIAPVMGMGGADWLERPESEGEESPEKMLDALEIKPGQTVADVGAGVGYLTLRIARRTGPTGKVYGV